MWKQFFFFFLKVQVKENTKDSSWQVPFLSVGNDFFFFLLSWIWLYSSFELNDSFVWSYKNTHMQTGGQVLGGSCSRFGTSTLIDLSY